MTSWARRIFALTLFAEDLAAIKAFFAETVGLPVVFEDGSSVVYDVGGVLLNYLDIAEAPGLVAPAAVGDARAGVRVQITIPVDDVEAVSARVVAAGTPLLRGPEVRPWGPTTATFRDPAGHVWEISA
ncbi:MAG TPA: VOC family protein [Candidatus Nanopelagicales bacterium]|nr:VOC family protein [Candidatus Nanopelagicales bacterium]